MKLQILREVLFHSFLLLMLAGGALSMLVGGLLALSPERVVRINQVMSCWVETESFGQALDKPRRLEKFLYRHHRLVGALITAGALYVLNFFLLSPAARNAVAKMSANRMGLLDGVISIFVVGSVLASAVGLMMLLKPSLLREIEQAANRWVSTDVVTNFFNRKHGSAEGFILRNPNIFAPFFILGGLYVAVRIGMLLLDGTWRSIL